MMQPPPPHFGVGRPADSNGAQLLANPPVTKTRKSLSTLALGVVVIYSLAASIASAQGVNSPFCPTASSVQINYLAGYSTDAGDTVVALRESFIGFDGSLYTYDFNAENVDIKNKQIEFDAPGVKRISDGEPLNYVSLGVLPAGDYTMTIRPIATNVTPNVACPILSVPLQVIAGYTYVPVSGPSGSWLGLLAALAGALGIGALWRRQHRLQPPSLDPKFGGTCP